MDPELLAQSIQGASLRPTATVVRGRNGKGKVEREELLSSGEKQERVAVSKAAGLARKGVCQQDKGHLDFPVASGVVYELGNDSSFQGAKRWTKAQEKGENIVALSTLRVLTFNVWFSEFAWEERLDGLVQLIRKEETQIVCLQEVTSRVISKLMEKYEDIQKQFRLVGSFLPRSWYGVMVLIRNDLPVPKTEVISLPTHMGRSALGIFFPDCSQSDIADTLANRVQR